MYRCICKREVLLTWSAPWRGIKSFRPIMTSFPSYNNHCAKHLWTAQNTSWLRNIIPMPLWSHSQDACQALGWECDVNYWKYFFMNYVCDSGGVSVFALFDVSILLKGECLWTVHFAIILCSQASSKPGLKSTLLNLDISFSSPLRGTMSYWHTITILHRQP